MRRTALDCGDMSAFKGVANITARGTGVGRWRMTQTGRASVKRLLLTRAGIV